MIAVWAALVAVSGLLPATPMISAAATFSPNSAFFPLTGIFSGPWAGAVCAAVDALLGGLHVPPVFGPLTFIIPTVAALVTGLAMQGE